MRPAAADVLAMLGHGRAGLFPVHVTVADLQDEHRGNPGCHHAVLEEMLIAGQLVRDEHGYRLTREATT